MMQPSSDMSQDHMDAFGMMRIIYRSLILENIEREVVHMVTYQRQRDMVGLRLTEGAIENTRSVYTAVDRGEFFATYIDASQTLEADSDCLILAIHCVETNMTLLYVMLKSEFIDETPDVSSRVISVRFHVNYAEGCSVCGSATSQLCARCRQVRYCSRECQIADLQNHRQGCRTIGRARGSQ